MAEESLHRRAYFTTGGTSGLGAAIVECLLHDDEEAIVINLGRSSRGKALQTLESAHGAAQLQEIFPHTVSGNRLQYRQVDLCDDAALDAELADVINFIRDNSLEVAGILHCAGLAVVHHQNSPEPEKTPKIEQMYQVNSKAAIKIGSAMKDSGTLAEHARFGYVASLGAYKDKLPVPGLEQYGDSKHQAENRLKELYGEDYFTVYPGIYQTPMVDGFIKDLGTALEFYGIAAGRAVPTDKLMVETSKVLTGNKDTQDVVYPLVPRWYVQLITEGRRDFLLPKFIKLFGKGILKMVGQGKEEHNARIEFHKKNQSYGENFPYDSLTYDKLFDERIGNSIVAIGRFLGLV